jgi:hypothetical protein
MFIITIEIQLEERFERLEAQVYDITRNIILLIVAIERKLRPFRDDGGSNSEHISEGKS